MASMPFSVLMATAASIVIVEAEDEGTLSAVPRVVGGEFTKMPMLTPPAGDDMPAVVTGASGIVGEGGLASVGVETDDVVVEDDDEDEAFAEAEAEGNPSTGEADPPFAKEGGRMAPDPIMGPGCEASAA
jgi:hypothetical protein